MSELERLGHELRDELGEPSPEWLRKQRRDLTVALGLRSPQRAMGGWWWAAAALLGLVGFAVWTLAPRWRPTGSTSVEVALSAPTAERNVPLADGSRLLLAAKTRAHLKTGDRVTRCVIERGKVQFDVVPQGGREFSVQAGALTVTVVGTRFSVSRDPNGSVEVMVSHGVVRVLIPNRNTPAELRAGDRLRADGREVLLQHAPADAASREPVPASQASAETGGPSVPPADAQPPPDALSGGGKGTHADWLSLYRSRDYAAALAAARDRGLDGLQQSLTAQPLFELAEAARLGGDGDLALRVFATLGQRFPASRQAQDALFLSGRLLASRGQLRAAGGQLEAYLARNGRGTYSVEALGRLLEIYATNKDPRAKTTAQAYLERAPHGPYQRLCRAILAAR
jgi:TolA-binding protein